MEAFENLPRDQTDEFFLHLSSRDQVSLLLALPEGERPVWLRLLPPDDAADILQLAPVEKRDNLLGQLDDVLTATAMGYFEQEIARAVVLALFLPLIISSGGNSGSQATTVVIRAMALGEVRLRDWWRVIYRELSAGLALGGVLAVIGMSRIVLWQAIWKPYRPHYVVIALTVACSLVGAVVFGTIAGSMLPFVLRRAGVDPASASAPFVATLVDVTGLGMVLPGTSQTKDKCGDKHNPACFVQNQKRA